LEVKTSWIFFLNTTSVLYVFCFYQKFSFVYALIFRILFWKVTKLAKNMKKI